jgi:imidazolonepropionase-like amidohydrolase
MFPGTGSPICLRGVYVLDESGGFDGPYDVAVREGIVEAVENTLPSGDYEEIEEYEGLWLMPGVFDCHAHLACWADDTLGYLQMPVTKWTLGVAANARRLLEMGVTFVRDPGGADAGVRDGIAEGLVPGPTVQVAISALSQTGGHADGFLPGPGLEMGNGFLFSDYLGRPPSVADGVDGVRLAVRKILRAGADWVKICTTGGLLSPGLDHPDEPEFAPDEIAAIVAEARRKGKPVMAHAYGGVGLTRAVEAGARSIEHGLRLTEEQAALMARHDCWFVPTLTVMHDLVAGSKQGEFTEGVTRRIEQIEPIIGEAVAIAREAGVRIALGTDLITQRANLDEIVFLNDSGLSVAESLLAATSGGATLCGVEERLGRITPGYEFDALVLDEDPSELEAFRRHESPAVAVFQRGRIVHRTTRSAADGGETRRHRRQPVTAEPA